MLILIFPIQLIKMNTWKILNKSKGSSVHGRASSRSHRQKYDPKREDNQSNISNRFHNKSIMKNQSSVFDQDSVKSNEKGRNILEGERTLKGCASQLKLRSNEVAPVKVKVFNPHNKKSNFHDSASEQQIHELLGDIRSGSRKNGKNGRNSDYQEEIKRIQADYKAFKAIILAELKKQEIMLHKMVRNLFEEFKETMEFKNNMEKACQKIQEPIQSDKNLMRGLKLKLDMEENKDKTYKSPQLIKFYSPTHKTQYFTNFNGSQSRTRKTHRQLNIEKHSFDKFMNAMKNLKEGMAEISQISDISSIKSPRASFEKKVGIIR